MTELKTNPAARKKVVLAASAVLLVLALVVGGYFALRGGTSGQDAEADSAAERVYTVRTIGVSPTAGDVSLRYTGLVQPADLVQVTAGTIGRVEKIYVAEGEAVTAGQLLVQLDDSDAVRQAENYRQVRDTAARALESAQRSQTRALEDYEDARGGASEGDLSAARDRLNRAKTREKTAQEHVDSINAALITQQEDVDKAQKNFDEKQKAYNDAAAESAAADAVLQQAQQELDEAVAAEEDASVTGDLQQAVDAAQERKTNAENALAAASTALDTARTALAAARAGLVAEQARLGYTDAQAELAAAQSERAAAQTAYDALAAQGQEDSTAVRAQKERLEAADTALDQARTNYDTAQRNYENALEAIEDCKLRADSDGYVVTIVSSEGGLATPLAPVLVLGSRNMIAQFGVSQSDVRELTPGMPATVSLDGQSYAGSIVSIAVLPDETTRTYPVDVSIGADFSEVYLGSMASVELQLGQRTGVWLPLSVILNDGEDYVYMVEDGRAVRRNVEILELSNDMVLVSGVHEGGQVISEGMKNVRSGSPVQVLGGEG